MSEEVIEFIDWLTKININSSMVLEKIESGKLVLSAVDNNSIRRTTHKTYRRASDFSESEQSALNELTDLFVSIK